MDKLMRSSRFDAEPNTLNAEREYKHWKKTFENYLEGATSEGDIPASLVRKKHHAFKNSVSANVFELIYDADNFNLTLQKLDEAFIKPINIIYNKHLLITSKQKQMQSIDSYMQGLEKLAQGCKLEAVDAKQNKEQYMRDAFTNGISSVYIKDFLKTENWFWHMCINTNFPSLAMLGGSDITSISCKINNSPLKSVIDSGSSSAFVNKNAAEKLKLFHQDQSVSLADPTCKAQVMRKSLWIWLWILICIQGWW